MDSSTFWVSSTRYLTKVFLEIISRFLFFFSNVIGWRYVELNTLSFGYLKNNYFDFNRSKNNYFYAFECKNKLFYFIYHNYFYPYWTPLIQLWDLNAMQRKGSKQKDDSYINELRLIGERAGIVRSICTLFILILGRTEKFSPESLRMYSTNSIFLRIHFKFSSVVEMVSSVWFRSRDCSNSIFLAK